jgi:MFS family permease
MPGALLAILQFAFALTWIVYVIYLPGLAAQAGIDKRYVPMILVMDQAIFIACDWAAGVYADRIARTFGRVGGTMAGITLVSCAAFIALPWIAPAAGVVPFLFVTVLWSATSSALRAPPFVLMSRHTEPSRRSWVAGLYLLGLGIASALAPYLGLSLKQVDPRIPFAVASIGLAAVAVALAHAESSWMAPVVTEKPSGSGTASAATMAAFVFAVLLFAIGFQVHFSINSAPSYQRFVEPGQLSQLMPVFWVGFNVAILPAIWLAKRYGATRVAAASGLIGAGAMIACTQAASLEALTIAQLVAGASWAIALTGLFAAATQAGSGGREGTFTGIVFSALAAAALIRLAMVIGNVPATAPIGPQLDKLPFVAWAVASMIVASLAIRRLKAAP